MTEPRDTSAQKFDAKPDGGLMRRKIQEEPEEHLSVEDTGKDKGESSSSGDKSLGGVGRDADDQVGMTTFLAHRLGQS